MGVAGRIREKTEMGLAQERTRGEPSQYAGMAGAETNAGRRPIQSRG